MVRVVKTLPTTPANCALLANWLLELTRKSYCLFDHKGSEHSHERIKLEFRVFDLDPVLFEAYPVAQYGKDERYSHLFPWQCIYDDMIKEVDDSKPAEAIKFAEQNASARAYVERTLTEVTSMFRSWELADARIEEA